MTTYITREIGIDMGHRVPTHGSKCRSLHGHRYRIEAVCAAEVLHEDGEQKDMVLDFGFLKDIMMRRIDGPFDHAMCLWFKDPLVDALGILTREKRIFFGQTGLETYFEQHPHEHIPLTGYSEKTEVYGKYVLVPFIPTAERLAAHWFGLMKGDVEEQSKELAALYSLRVWETPNCSAAYFPEGSLA